MLSGFLLLLSFAIFPIAGYYYFNRSMKLAATNIEKAERSGFGVITKSKAGEYEYYELGPIVSAALLSILLFVLGLIFYSEIVSFFVIYFKAIDAYHDKFDNNTAKLLAIAMVTLMPTSLIFFGLKWTKGLNNRLKIRRLRDIEFNKEEQDYIRKNLEKRERGKKSKV